MASIRIDNLSDDSVTVIFDGKSYTIGADERQTAEGLEKGRHTLTVCRARLLSEQSESSEGGKDILKMTERQSQSQHTQLSCTYKIETDASRCVAAIKCRVFRSDTRAVDALFSGYSLSLTGAHTVDSTEYFASKQVKRRFIAYQLKNAFLPVGIGGIILFLVGLYTVGGALRGTPVNLGGTKFTLPWAIGLTAVGTGFLGYTVFSVVRILLTAKRLLKSSEDSGNV